jgi:hypothetical protein
MFLADSVTDSVTDSSVYDEGHESYACELNSLHSIVVKRPASGNRLRSNLIDGDIRRVKKTLRLKNQNKTPDQPEVSKSTDQAWRTTSSIPFHPCIPEFRRCCKTSK